MKSSQQEREEGQTNDEQNRNEQNRRISRRILSRKGRSEAEEEKRRGLKRSEEVSGELQVQKRTKQVCSEAREEDISGGSDSDPLIFSREANPGIGVLAREVVEETEDMDVIRGNVPEKASFLRSYATGSNINRGIIYQDAQGSTGQFSAMQSGESTDREEIVERNERGLVSVGLKLGISETPVDLSAADRTVYNKMKKIEEQNRTLKQILNEYKLKVSKFELENNKLRSANDALSDQLFRKDHEINSLILENESIRVSSGMSSSKYSKAGKAVEADEDDEVEDGKKKSELKLDAKFLGIASCVERNVQSWCRMEIQELYPWNEKLKRNWICRSEITGEMGFRLEKGKYCVPIPPLTLAARHEYYTPYYKDNVSILRGILNVELGKSKWSSIISEDSRKECESSILGEKYLIRKVRNHLSEELNRMKRNARDKLMRSLGYSFIESRARKPRSIEEKEEKKKQREELLDKLFGIYDGEDSDDILSIDLSCWRTRNVQLLSFSGYIIPENIGEELADDLLIRSKIANHVLQEFRGFNISKEENKTIHSSILLLARLDAWIMTFCKCANRDEDKGGETQKKFKKEFSRLLPEATKQILGYLCNIVRNRYPEELQILYGEDGKDPFGNENRIATLVVKLPSDERFYILVKPSWFRKEVSSCFGYVMDCYIGRGNGDGSNLELEGNDENKRKFDVVCSEEV